MDLDAGRLVEDLMLGDARALARAISIVEDRGKLWKEIMRRVYPHTGRACVVGVTGTPGAGKSTLVGHVGRSLLERGHALGIVAVDPSSPYTGGALLGDRLRMRDISSHEGVFIRSMATRGALGGLCPAARDVCRLMEANGRDVVIIETVGVGQDEIEVVSASDWVVLVTFPGQGDAIQAIKAGVMEIADIFVVNKADREGAGEMASAIEAMLDLATGPGQERPPVFMTSCLSGEGVSALSDHVEDLVSRRKDEPARDRRRVAVELMDLLDTHVRGILRERLGRDGIYERAVDAVMEGRADPYEAAWSLAESLGFVGGPLDADWGGRP
ncbi:MAG TPA: methylmalonyl Co-A mutase-associated GTPase MeaB [Deltaproteobacteria bacterium]|nr:methylmalonyl Co-A mutase-associated GTPase MeaB [Deltaproteobacteria bacterium]